MLFYEIRANLYNTSTENREIARETEVQGDRETERQRELKI